MINQVYELGIKEKDCHWDTMKNNPKLKGSKVYKILNSYFANFKQIIDVRHLNTHRGTFKDSKKDDLESELGLYEAYEDLNEEVDDEVKRMFPKFIIDWRVKEYRKEKMKFVKETKKVIEAYVKNFFDEISLEFEKNKNIKKTHNI